MGRDPVSHVSQIYSRHAYISCDKIGNTVPDRTPFPGKETSEFLSCRVSSKRPLNAGSEPYNIVKEQEL
jgi:hypothetical protein